MTASSTYAQRRTHLLLALLVVGVWGLLLRAYLPFAVPTALASSAKESVTFDTLTVQRINITDSDGKTRLIIANSARFPDVEVRGKVYPRSIHDTAGFRCSRCRFQRASPCLASTRCLARRRDDKRWLVPADGRGTPPRRSDVSARIDVPIMRYTTRTAHPGLYNEHVQSCRTG